MARDNTAVKFFDWRHGGAPVLSGMAGSRAAVLDACLVTGWGATAVTQIVVAGGVATAHFASGHPFASHQVLTLINAAPVADGEYRVRSVTGSTVVFGVDDAISNQTVTNSGMTLTVTAGGWQQAFSPASNKRVYRSADILATARFYYRLDDSAAQFGRVTGYVSMTNADTGAEAFEPAAGGGYVPGSFAASSEARKWVLATDGRLVLWFAAPKADGWDVDGAQLTAFGEPAAYLNSDLHCAIVAAGTGNNTGYSTDPLWATASNSTGWVAARSAAAGAGAGAVAAPAMVLPTLAASVWSGNTSMAPAPEWGSPILLPMLLGNAGNAVVRGEMPGLMFLSHNLGLANASYPLWGLSESDSLGARYVHVAPTGYNPSFRPTAMLDVTGPWR